MHAAALWLALLPGAAPAPHPGPPLVLRVDIGDERVVLQLWAEQKTVNPWFGVAGLHPPPLDPEIRSALEAGAFALLRQKTTVLIDGEEVLPVFAGLQTFEFGAGNPEPSLQVDLAYDVAHAPRTVEVRWGLYAEDGSGVETLFWFGTDFESTILLPGEPAYTWHAKDLTAPASGAARGPVAPGRPRGFPALSLVVCALAALAAFFARGQTLRVALLGLGLVAAVGLRGVGRTRTPWGGGIFGGGRIELPSARGQVDIFGTLHRRIYDAFSAQGERELYSMLASAVDLDALDELYGEIYESLVLRSEGGAVCRIEHVTPLTYALPEVPLERELAFSIEWAWRVDGTVAHWGHTHQRTNEYRALYTVGYDGEGWKIADWETLEHSRSDDGDRPVQLVGGDLLVPVPVEWEGSDDEDWEVWDDDEWGTDEEGDEEEGDEEEEDEEEEDAGGAEGNGETEESGDSEGSGG